MDEENIREKIIILDTNFLVSNTGRINEIIPKINENGYKAYIPQLVQEEYINIQLRKIKKQYTELEVIKKENHYMNIRYSDAESIFSNNEKAYRNSFKAYFGENVIPYNQNEVLKDVLERNKYKEPPFYNEHGSSDKGFKDTIIWLSLKNFINNYNSSAKFYYVTSDNGFIKYKQYLEDEIGEDKLEILNIKSEVELYEKLEIVNSNNKEQELNDENVFNKQKCKTDVGIIRDKINELLYNMNTYIETDYYGNVCEENRYEISEYIDFDDAKNFLENIPNVIRENIFRKTLPIEDFFKGNTNMTYSGTDIEIEIMNDIYSLYEEVRNTEYKDSFINFIKQKINENKKSTATFIGNSNDDLPF